MSATSTRVVLVGIGGATCSGKTTLAKHLRSIIPGSFIIHQDDFAPPQELVPMHPVYNVQDWDAPAGAIDWTRLITFLRTLKSTGEYPRDHKSHDHLNEQKAVPIPEELTQRWRSEFERSQKHAEDRGEKLLVGLVDGFLLYWHKDVIDQLDARIFLRVPHDVLRQRRHERHGYHTAVQSDPEGSLWRDPPHYWEQIVYPAYVDAHREVFLNEDVEHGAPGDKVKDLCVMEPLKQSMGEVVEEACKRVQGHLTR